MKNLLDEQAKFVRSDIGVSAIFGVVQSIMIAAQAFSLSLMLSGLFFEHRSLTELLIPLIFFVLALGGRALCNYFKDLAGLRANTRVKSRLRTQILGHIKSLGPSWRVGEEASSVSHLYLEHVDSLGPYFSKYLPHQTVLRVAPLLFGLLVFSQNWLSGLILFVTFPLIPLFMVLVGKGAKHEQDKQMKSLRALSGEFLDLIRGMTSLRIFKATKRFREGLAHNAGQFRLKTLKVLRLAFLSSTVLEFFTVLSIALVALQLGFNLLGFLNGGEWVGDLGLAQAFFILLLAPEFFLPLRELGAFYHAKAEAQSAAEIIDGFLTTKPMTNTWGQFSLEPRPPTITLENLSFAYGGDGPLFEALNLRLEPETITAIRGPSGGGKTTLLKLIMGHMTPNSGRILVQGRPLRDIKKDDYLGLISWMNQSPRLLHDSLRANLHLANQGANDSQLEDALEWAGLWPWYEGLSLGLEAPLGEGGRPLSGGQLRRLALARVFLKNPKLVLLDEPTASLDEQTRNLVLERIKELGQRATVLLLTHHLDTAAIAHQSLSLNKGRLA